jgi:hypothetical protein
MSQTDPVNFIDSQFTELYQYFCGDRYPLFERQNSQTNHSNVN